MGVGAPGGPKVNFCVSVGYRSGEPRPGKFLTIGHVQSRGMLPQLSTQQVLQKGSLLFCVLLMVPIVHMLTTHLSD